MKKVFLLLAALVSLQGLSAQVPTAMDIAADMVPGWNLGNTLEAGPCSWLKNDLDWETGWQSSKTTQVIIDEVKKQGFRSVRIPCAWFIHMDENYNISPTWMDRVQEVVDYCIKDDLYVVLNDHYDNGWIERSFKERTAESVDKNCFILGLMWKQIATRFRDYDHHLLFAGMNEPDAAGDGSADKQGDVATLVQYEQTFVNAVRQTGGGNATRVLVVQAPSTSIDLAYQYDVMPTDEMPDALMLEVHFYSPYNFTMMTKDESWGYQAYYWGAGNHVSGSNHNVTWGEEAYVQEQFRQMKTKYTSKGVPVVMGEFGTLWRTMPQGENQEKHDDSVYAWYKAVCRYAVHNGLVPMVWDTNGCKRPSMDVLNRKTLTVFNQRALDGIMDGCASVKWPYASAISAVEERCPSSLQKYGLSGVPLRDAPPHTIYIQNGKKYMK
ncbi:MAG: glycoside hydrolase family 5 protein [Bacteroidaceae bacterium]|nr:glycoside hydrolase family 5 protein [Bacteroidaceae bacterium]